MGTVSSASSVLSNLLQNLAAESPSLSSVFSAPNVQSALANASPGDLVELSEQAQQLQQVGVLFGDPSSTQASGLTSADSLFSILSAGSSASQSNLITEALQSSTGLTGTASSSQVQEQELESLLGTTSSANPPIDTFG